MYSPFSTGIVTIVQWKATIGQRFDIGCEKFVTGLIYIFKLNTLKSFNSPVNILVKFLPKLTNLTKKH